MGGHICARASKRVSHSNLSAACVGFICQAADGKAIYAHAEATKAQGNTNNDIPCEAHPTSNMEGTMLGA
eukprot:11040546-Alexandrium_andersonii.AAC.1